MLQAFLTLNVFGFFLIFSRVGTTFLLLPGFSAGFVSPRMRLVFALAVTFVVAPVLAASLPGLPETPAGLGLLVIGEVVIGAFLGTIGRILMGALQTAGTLISYMSSMANAFIQDPIAEQQSSLFAGFLGTTGVVLIFVTNTHHVMLGAVVDSYSLFLPGQPIDMGDMGLILARRVAESFALGVQLASPFIVTGLTYYLGLGLLGRLMPALPVFFVGLPIQIAIQISVFALTISGIMMVFLSRFEEGFSVFLVP